MDTLTQANEQLQRDMTRKFAQLQTQHQHQQAGWQEELQGSTQEEIDVTRSHIEQVDKTGRLCNLVVKGIRPPAGGRGALGLNVQDLLVKHAGIPKQSIADVSCIGPIRSAGVKLVRVRLTSVSDKHAAFRASAALRREKVYLDDDLTRAQQATRRRLEPARQRYMSQGMPAWWRGDTLLFRQHGEVHKHDDARRSDRHASQHQSSSPMHASPRHPPAAAVPTVGAARPSDAGGPVNQAPPSGAIAATSPPPGPTLPPPPRTDMHFGGHAKQLLQLCLSADLILGTGRLPGDIHAPLSYPHAAGGSRPDHLALDLGIAADIQTSTVDSSRLESDHFPLCVTFQCSLAPQPGAVPGADGTPLPRLSWDDSHREAYVQALDGFALDACTMLAAVRSHPQQPHCQLGRDQRLACALPGWLSSTALHRAPTVRLAPFH